MTQEQCAISRDSGIRFYLFFWGIDDRWEPEPGARACSFDRHLFGCVNVYTHVGECLDLERTQPQSFECMCTTLWISLIRLIIGWRGWGENCQNGTTDNYFTPLRGQFGCLFLSTSEFVLDSWFERNYYRAIKVGSCKKSFLFVCLFVIVATNYFETEVFNRKWSHLLMVKPLSTCNEHKPFLTLFSWSQKKTNIIIRIYLAKLKETAQMWTQLISHKL